MTPLEKELRSEIEGDVRFDSISRRAYSVDASIYEIEPMAVVIPKSKKDLIKAVQIARANRIPIIARGAATGITGGCLGKGLIIDTSKYLNRIVSIDYEKEEAVCEPGVVQDALNLALSEKGYRLGPDTSTGNRATIGGMAANNAAGARSLYYGKMSDHVEKIELLLSSGNLYAFGPNEKDHLARKLALQTQEGFIYRTAINIAETKRDEIIRRFPNIPRRVSGYNLDELIKKDPFNLAKLLVGSEGTLGVFTEITVKIAKKPKATGLCLLHFSDMIEALRHVPYFLSFHPLSLEMIDSQIISLGRQSASMKGKMDWLQGTPEALLIIEFAGETLNEVKARAAHFIDCVKIPSCSNTSCLFLPKEMDSVLSLRKAGLGILLSKRSYSRAIAFLEDISISPTHLADFMQHFCAYLKGKGKTAGIYGHVGSGCMHIRPYIDLRSPHELKLMEVMMQDIASLLLQYGGALSGEHGDGIIRSWLLPKMYGNNIIKAFEEIKNAFDPENLMNPGKIVYPDDPFKNLRLSPESIPKEPSTFLDFSKEGGFALSADLCNGNGLCRKNEGLMCPSFQADKDEYHTTRARAQALRAMIHGRLEVNDFSNKGIYDVLDLCLSCKGCKTECPSQVDMAKMKAEFLYQHQKIHGTPLRSRLFGHIGAMNQLLAPFASLYNWAARSFAGKWMQSLMGIAKERQLPMLAKKRFSQIFKGICQPKCPRSVVLFNDTFTEFNHPEIGIAAIQVLNSIGYNVILPSWKCCGRPLITKGLLKEAKDKANDLSRMLIPYIQQGLPIIGLEPSCLLTIKDDFSDLIDEETAKKLHRNCMTFDAFLAELAEREEFIITVKTESPPILFHGHCHQKALEGTGKSLSLLRKAGFDVIEIPSGCCGMAGSFGYESEHYLFSMQIGEKVLFPAIRSAKKDAVIVANGTSCRTQIFDGTEKHAKHIAELIAEYRILYRR